MDRWEELGRMAVPTGELCLAKQGGVRLYDGEQKVAGLEDTAVEVTSHRILARQHCLGLGLHQVSGLEKEEGGFFGSDKLVVRLLNTKQQQQYVKLSFRSGGQQEFHTVLARALADKAWEAMAGLPVRGAKREIRAGITGIEKKMNQQAKQDSANISKAFADLDRLIASAGPMVALAQNISTKIRERQGEISEDETVQFKSYLLSLGVDDPITKDSAGSDKKYYQGLAKEMFLILDQPIQAAGGMMTLTDCWVRVNRARGLELVSPEDLLSAAKQLQQVSLPMKLHTFESGVLVLCSSNHSQEEVRQSLVNQVESLGSLTAEELSRESGVSMILARERLLAAEAEGLLARDDSVQGLRFYTNRFLVES